MVGSSLSRARRGSVQVEIHVVDQIRRSTRRGAGSTPSYFLLYPLVGVLNLYLLDHPPAGEIRPVSLESVKSLHFYLP